MKGVVAPGAVVAVVLAILVGCGDAPVRPRSVPDSATWVHGPKGGNWQWCFIEPSGESRCSIISISGRIFFDEVFLPYDEGPKVQAVELTITPNGTADTVKLKNGRMLLPQSQFTQVKRYWDWRAGKVENP